MVQGQPQRIGQYEIRGVLGSGGFATVYRAHDSVLEREVALKVLHPHLARDAGTRERFIREGRSLARVKHPNVVTVYGAGEADGYAYLATDLIEGRPLSAIIKERGPLTLAELAWVIDQVAAALAAVHAQNLVHRDIKPDNVMMETATGRAVLLDLGVARDLGNATMATGLIVGTPGYMAPEQVRAGGQVTSQTDVYQLASTTYALLVGRPPFEGDTIQVLDAIVRYTAPDLRAYRPDVPPGVVAVINGAMSKDPGARPPGTRAFARALREAAGLPLVPTPAPGIDPAMAPTSHAGWGNQQTFHQGSPRTKNRLPVFAGGAAAAVLLVGGIFALNRDQRSQPPASPTPEPLPAVQLYNALLALPFQERELPRGFSKPEVFAGDMNEQSRGFGGIGEVGVDLVGPASSNLLWYIVFPTRTEAQKDFDKSSPGQDAAFKTTTNVPGLGDQAQCFDYVSNPGVDKFAGTFCQVLSDNVIVGASLRADGDVSDEKAKDLHGQTNELATSGLKHLNMVKADPQARTVAAPTATPRTSATPTPATRTATRTPTRTRTGTPQRVSRTPQELYNALLTIAWLENEMPRGVTVTRVYPGSLSDEFKTHKAVGIAIADTEGSGNNDYMSHTVYSSATDAEAHWSGYGKGEDAARSFKPSGFDVPIICIRRPPASGQTAGRTFCTAQVDNVQVQGTSTVEGKQSGNDDVAVSLTRAGIQHLRRVQVTRQ